MSNQTKGAIRAALKASSWVTVRPAPKPFSREVDQLYRARCRQVEEMLGLHPHKKEGAAGEFLGCLGGLLGLGLGLTALFYVLSRI